MLGFFAKKYIKIAIVVVVLVLVFISILIYYSTAPTNFPLDSIVKIDKGSTLSETATLLHDNGIIRSPFLYKVAVVLTGSSKNIVQGQYSFARPESVLRIALRTIRGQYGFSPIKVTIPEGLSSSDIANILSKNIPGFDSKLFKDMAKQDEGYLFPDTYYFYKNSTPEGIINQMHATFDDKIASITDDIARFGKPLSDVVIMASIVEKEAMTNVDRRIIAGILWKRMAKGMPLQVDPPFYYILNKTSGELTLNDLAIQSPYNLYKHTGLPPTPISNPGLETIIDTITPTPTPYLFYLSDTDGNMHYSSDFDGHIANKQKYLQ